MKKGKTHKPIFIYNATFRTNIYVSYGITADEFLKSVKYHCSVELKETPEDKYGRMTVLYNPDGAEIIWLWLREKNVSELAHEALHAVHYDLKNKGMNLTDDSEEAYAYYIQQIIREVLQVEKNLKGRKKNV